MRHPTRISLPIEQFSVDWSNRTVGSVKSEVQENASIFLRIDLSYFAVQLSNCISFTTLYYRTTVNQNTHCPLL